MIYPSSPPFADTGRSGLVSTTTQVFDGSKTFNGLITANTGLLSARVFNLNGTGSSDVGVKAGVSTADASVHATAHPFSVRTGIGGTESEKFWVTKNGPAMSSSQAFEINGDGGGVKLQYRTGDGMAGLHNGASAYLGMFPGTGASGCSGAFTSDAGIFKAPTSTGVQVFGQNGAGSTDVGTKVGTSLAFGSLHASAKIFAIRTEIGGGGEAERFGVYNDGSFYFASNTLAKLYQVGNRIKTDIGFTAGGYIQSDAGTAFYASTNGGYSAPANVKLWAETAAAAGARAIQAGAFLADASLDAAVKLFSVVTNASSATPTEKVFFVKDGTQEFTGAGVGIVMQSPNGTRWRLTITNAGATQVAAA